MTRGLILLSASLFLVVSGVAPSAQTRQQAPNMPPPDTTIPEKIKPQDPSATGSTGAGESLSEKLESTEGVIKPPSGIDPEITTPAPVPNPGTTPVIPPPGSPGGNPAVRPK
jgi:hypothetical protein